MSSDSGDKDAVGYFDTVTDRDNLNQNTPITKTKRHKRPRSTPSPVNSSSSNRSPAHKKKSMPNVSILDKIEEMFNSKFHELSLTLASKADIESLSTKIDNLNKENLALKKEVSSLTKNNSLLMARLEKLENEARRNNLVFRGIVSDGNISDPITEVQNFCKNNLHIAEDLWINSAKVIKNTGDQKLIIANIPKNQDMEKIMSNGPSLAGTSFSVSRDFSFGVRKKRAKLFALKKEIKSKSEVDVKVVFDHIFINQLRFELNEELKLIYKGKCGLEKLREICPNISN